MQKPINPEMAREGQKIIRVIVAGHVVVSAGNFFVNLYAHYFLFIAFLALAYHIGIAVALVRGYMFVKYWFAVGWTLMAFNAGVMIFSGELSLWAVVLNVIVFLFAAGAGAFLFFNKCVTEYMLDRNDGW
jgi:hypothetical protein